MKKFTLLVLIAAAFSGAFAQTSTAPSGTGTSGDPYQIATLNNLYWLTQNSAQWNKYFIQTANIDAAATSTWNAGAGFNQIGNATKFTGSYDGQGHTVSNLFISRSGTNYVGFFGQVGQPAVIKQLGISSATVTGGIGTGILIGYISGSATVTVTRCFSTGTASGTYGVGGLIGVADVGTIVQCYSAANANIASGSPSEVGGFIGENRAAISNCYALGNVTSTPSFTGGGGFAGANYGGVITNCYSTGTVTGTGTKGGLVGTNALSGTAPNSFWDTQTSAQASSTIGTGKTTAQMKTSITFTGAGWDFAGETTNGINDYWSIDGVTNNGYPNLQYSITLPVTWVSFTALKQAEAALLQWQTVAEQNALDFQVQRSTNGTEWTVIGTVAATGSAGNTAFYSFKDNNPAKGNNYYRLVQRDIQGKNSYSATASLAFRSATVDISVYPNPVVNGKMNLILENKAAGTYTIIVLDEAGNTVCRTAIKHGGGSSTHAIQLSGSLSKTIYQVKIIGAGETAVLKIMLQ